MILSNLPKKTRIKYQQLKIIKINNFKVINCQAFFLQGVSTINNLQFLITFTSK